ncbi:MAG: hypothetical protein J6M18_03760 [Actinomycetaceae bacterium]|nr:hypothetical protein [Actinomycetaceae bacterium]
MSSRPKETILYGIELHSPRQPISNDSSSLKSNTSHKSSKTEKKSRFFTFALPTLIVTIIIGLIVIHTRFDVIDAAPPKASEAETTRQNLAEHTSRLIKETEILNKDHSAFSHAKSTIQSWQEYLGDVWIPWPNAEDIPSGQTNPPVHTDAQSSITTEEFIKDLSLYTTQACNAAEKATTAQQKQTLLTIAFDSLYLTHNLASSLNITSPQSTYAITTVGKTLQNSQVLKSINKDRQFLERDYALNNEKYKDNLEDIHLLHSLEEAILRNNVSDTRIAVAQFPRATKQTLTEAAIIDTIRETIKAASLGNNSAEEYRHLIFFLYHLTENSAINDAINFFNASA